MSDKRVLVPLVAGFEEIEAVTIIDVLRRAGVSVVIAAEQAGSVRGAHDIDIGAEVSFADVVADDLDMIVLPGGMPGSATLAAQPQVQALIKAVQANGDFTCAICAAPIALAAAGVHQGKTLTCYPGFQGQLEGGDFTEERVVIDGKVVTSRGPGSALEFALTLAGLLVGDETEANLEAGMLVVRAAPATVVNHP
jgi:4-methyl-5(b-hydroxyethyl)-thiazole monophosphate biosynthesis